MAIAFRCHRYPTLRVARGDDSYINFLDGIAYASNARDVAILRAVGDFVIEDPATAGKDVDPTMLTPPRLDAEIVNWYSPLYGVADGYGSSAEQMMLALERAGYDVRTTHRNTIGPSYIRDITRKPQKRGAVRVVYCPPHPGVWAPLYEGQAVLGFSMWEDSMLPPIWNETLKEVDAIAAPSRFCVDLFQERLKALGVETPVCLVPLGVRADLFPYREREFARGNDTFTVLHNSTRMQETRKGAAEAYAAFRKAFEGQSDVKLIMRAKDGRIDVGGDPRVEFREGVVDDATKLRTLYESHVLLYPSFGEGFGIIPMEAIASGLPAIVSDNTAMSDYRDLFYPIECDAVPSELWTSFQAHSDGEWYRPRVDEAAAQLRRVYENYQQARAFAAKAAKAVRKRWNYDLTALALIEAMETATCSFNRRHRTSP